MPEWFVIPGIIIATAAAIIASQALISGSFTLISEAMRLNLWPKMKMVFPTEERARFIFPASIPLVFWLYRHGIIFPGIYQYGSGLWPCNNAVYACHLHPVCQLPYYQGGFRLPGYTCTCCYTCPSSSASCLPTLISFRMAVMWHCW